MVWNHYLYTLAIHVDSRMQSAIRAPDPVREGRHPVQVRGPSGGRTFVHIPQIGEGGADKHSAASSIPLRRRPNFT
jgi:hypothetical protein